ncbi:MAG TPA: TIGR03960 family B12-binding radical SAM protein [Spirochaetota bacterium]|nr:TIGR03960 family B12-binding radical SAM protein [Spirochaetota bacterium]
MNNINIKDSLGKFLHLVQKPARYFGNELNMTVKDDARVRVALSYPDLYEVGMSNNGIKILYDAANRVEGAACERVFAVAPDFESELRARNIPLYSLETYTPLHELDAVGFNLSHELLASNMLQVLDLGRIPMLRKERKDSDPVVIAGGEAVSNPFPYADFVDIFFIGDGEEGFPEIMRTLLRCRSEGITSRDSIIAELKKIDGILASVDYELNYTGLGADISGFKKVKKVSVKAEGCFSPAKPLVPSIRISQERAVVELARGCSNLCKFCHAGYYSLPYRPFNFEKAAHDIFRQIDNTGYDEVTLTALSVSDYKHIVKLLNSVLPELTERGVSIALPSLKVDRNTLPIIETVSNLRKSSLTFAVESASDEIRSLSNKKVRKEDLYDIVDYAFNHGWRVIKLYFMIGLPGCSEADEAEEIIVLLKDLVKRGRGKKDINVTISPFIPKPHTPFDHEKQMSMDYFHEVIRKVKSASPRQITIKNHDVRSSFIEGLLARGDTRIGTVIYNSYLAGARLDSWSEYFRFDIWMGCIEKYLPEWKSYLEERDSSISYPWQVIETGGEKAVSAMRGRKLDIESYRQPEKRYNEELDADKYKTALKHFELKYPTAQTLRFVFSKTGNGKYIGHIDFNEIIKRGFRMAGVPVSFSQGFNKREKIACGYPVPLGVESISEVVDVELYSELSEPEIAELPAKINPRLPEFLKVEKVRMREKSVTIMALTNAVEYLAEFGDEAALAAAAVFLGTHETFIKKGKKEKGEQEYLLKEILNSYKVEGHSLTVILYTGKESSVRIDEFLSGITGIPDISGSGVKIVKQCQYKLEGEALELIQ